MNHYCCTEKGHMVTSPDPLDACPVCGAELEIARAIDIASTVKVVKRG